MDAGLIQAIARECLGLDLTIDEAAGLVQPYVGLQRLVRAIEAVRLPYVQDPFVSPATGDAWLEDWPEQ
jgi:hypothetical protein